MYHYPNVAGKSEMFLDAFTRVSEGLSYHDEQLYVGSLEWVSTGGISRDISSLASQLHVVGKGMIIGL